MNKLDKRLNRQFLERQQEKNTQQQQKHNHQNWLKKKQEI